MKPHRWKRAARLRYLRELGSEAATLRAKNFTLREIALELRVNVTRIHRALKSIGEGQAPYLRHTKLLADGRKALAILGAGHSHEVALMVIKGSRARYFRAIREARLQDGTPDSEPVNPMLL